MIIQHIQTVNGHKIYKRKRKHETWIPLYVVFPESYDENVPSEGEFRRLKQAIRFCEGSEK